jgi:hypothetical protein
MPVFALCQKTGVLNRGARLNEQALADQFAVEAGIYVWRAEREARHYADKRLSTDVCLAMLAKSLAIGESAPKDAKASGYRLMVLHDRWDALEYIGRKAEFVAELSSRCATETDPWIRCDARDALGIFYGRQRDYAKARECFETMSRDGENLTIRAKGLNELLWIGRRSNDTKLLADVAANAAKLLPEAGRDTYAEFLLQRCTGARKE